MRTAGKREGSLVLVREVSAPDRPGASLLGSHCRHFTSQDACRSDRSAWSLWSRLSVLLATPLCCPLRGQVTIVLWP